MKLYQIFCFSIITYLLSGFSLSDLRGQSDNCIVPDIEAGQAMIDYRDILEERADAIPDLKKIKISDEELTAALRDYLCKINDVLSRMYASKGRSFFELTDDGLVLPNARIYPFYYHRQPNRDLSLNEWERDMVELMEQHGIAFNIEFNRLVVDRIDAFMARIFITADYTFFPAFNEANRTIVNSEVNRKMQVVIEYTNDDRSESGYVLELRALTGDISTREEVGYSEFYVHATAGIESYSSEMSTFWGSSDRNLLPELGLIPGDLTGADGNSLNNSPFGNWNLESVVNWGIDLGYAFTLDRFGKHGIDIAAGLHFSKIEAAFNHNGIGIYSGEDNNPAFSNEVGAEAETRYWLGYLESARMEASRTSLNITVGYRYNIMNRNRRLIYFSPRFYINNTLSYSNIESAANLGFGFVSSVKNNQGELIGYGQFAGDAIGDRSMDNATADGSLMYGLGLAAGFSIPMDRAGNVFFSGRLYYDFAIGGSALDHNMREQHYLNKEDFNAGNNYLTDFGDHIRSSRFGLSLGLSYLLLK